MPTASEAAGLMTAPEGTVRAGDEFHRPEHWRSCPHCGTDVRVSAESCYRCGAAFDPETVGAVEFDHGDNDVVGTCTECGREIHAGVAGHGCADGFRRHPDGEGIAAVAGA